jgi:CHRD domain
MARFTVAVAAAAVTLVLAGADGAETVKYRATMNGASEVPPKQTQGTGTVDATLDTSTRKLDWTANWQNLSGPATAAHFHGPAAPGANAPIVVPWGQNPTSPNRGSATLTPEQMQDLQNGKWYANVHTAQNQGGEIRGQMERAQ